MKSALTHTFGAALKATSLAALLVCSLAAGQAAAADPKPAAKVDLARGSQIATQVCAACHGADFRGSVLSRTAATRDWGGRTVARGTAVGCYDCHNGPNGGD